MKTTESILMELIEGINLHTDSINRTIDAITKLQGELAEYIERVKVLEVELRNDKEKKASK
jgi:hypothetical protein